MLHKQQNYSSAKLTCNIWDIRSESGIGYVMILLILVLMSSLSLAFHQKVGTETSATMNRGKNMQAHYLAETAANHAMWRLLNETTSSIDIRVGFDNDDAEEFNDTSMDLNRDRLEIGKSKYGGMRFPNVTIPNGTSITSAYIDLKAHHSHSENTDITIRGEDIDDVTNNFGSANGDISNRTQTTASVTWNSIPGWNAGTIYKTPDISSIIQEIVDRPGWSSGNSMVIMFESTDPGGQRCLVSHDTSSADAPLLHIEYSTTGFPPPNVYTMHSLAGGRYGYKIRRHTDTTFATIATVGAIEESVVNQSYVLYVKPTLTEAFPCPKNLLFVVPDAALLGAQDTVKKDLFEDWGYVVTAISAGDSQAAFDTAVSNSNVAYISEEITSSNLGTKLRDATIGVVLEEGALTDEFGISSSRETYSSTDIDITAFSHYITDPFSAGALTITSSAQDLIILTGTVASGLDSLAENKSLPTLAAINQGAQLYDKGTAAGRRVQLPWGPSAFDINALNTDGETIMERAIEWATGIDDGCGPIISTDSDAILGGLSFTDIDLVKYNSATDTASLFFDGSLTTLDQDITAVHVLANGHIVLSAKGSTTLGGVSFEDDDLVDYNPVADTATLIFDGSTLFDASNEKIISVHVLGNGHFVLSTDSAAILGGLSFTDRDLVEYDPATDTATLFFDGSLTTLSQDITSVHVLSNGHIVLSAKGSTTLGGVSFDNGDLVDYDPVADTATLIFDGSTLFDNPLEKIISVHIGIGSGGGGGSPAVLDIQVATDNDDAEESVSSGSVNLGSSDLELVYEGSNNQLVGIRFVGVTVPPGSTITNAYIQFKVDETDSGATEVNIEIEDIDNAPAFTTTNSDISNRTTASASVSWAPPAWNTVGEQGLDQQTPDISNLIQAVVDRAGWASGNAMVIIMTGKGERTAESHDGDALGAPILHIEYITGGIEGPSYAGSVGATNDFPSAIDATGSAEDPCAYRYDISHNGFWKNFGFNIPAGSTIDGIKVEYHRAWDEDPPTSDSPGINIGKNESTLGTEKVDTTLTSAPSGDKNDCTVSKATVSFGGSTDTWGLSLTPADINSSDFTVRFRNRDGEEYGWSISWIRVTVYYTPP